MVCGVTLSHKTHCLYKLRVCGDALYTLENWKNILKK